MISLSRRRIIIPEELRERSAKARARLIKRQDNLAKQTRLTFDDEVWIEYRPFLHELTRGKCAYCESPLRDDSPDEINHFRPIRSVDQDASHPGYYWLAYEWTNLLPSCAACSRNKGDQFPLRPGTARAQPSDPDVRIESPMMIDPCAAREIFGRHFHFRESGEITAASPRGDATIAILGLNRSQLVAARRAQGEKMRKTLLARFPGFAKVNEADRGALLHAVREFTQSRAPYAGFCRQYFEYLAGPPPLRLHPPRIVQQVVRVRPIQRIRRRPYKEETLSPDVLPKAAGFVQRIEIRNFKCIRSLSLDIEFAQNGRTGWKMLLGENGAGKSSVLQAVALALAGPRSTQVKGGDLLRRGAKRGQVKVWLSTEPNPVTVTISNRKVHFQEDGVATFVRGYGALRITEKIEETPAAVSDSRRQIRNLFDPHYPLVNPNRWLKTLTPADFDRVAITLKDVLRIEEDVDNLILVRENNEIHVKTPSRPLGALHTLSRGQQAVLELATDIMAGIMQHGAEGSAPFDFRQSKGIVLLDEIDAHLHPRWKMKIVTRLRTAFPNLQFLVTTHEPLCLRGLTRGEIVRMHEDKGEVGAQVCDVSLDGWRIDQILTSPLFGLYTTIDPDLDRNFRRYYELLARGEEKLSGDERTKLGELRQLVHAHNRLGYTRRDQLLYEVIDRAIAKEGLNPSPQVSEATRKRVAQIWDRITRRADA